MDVKILILLEMIFLHILDDFNLQTAWLSNGKQKSYWEENAPDNKYKYDYVAALFIHSLSWSILMMMPVFIYTLLNEEQLWFTLTLFMFNVVIHAFIDDLKANRFKINLIQDQIIHMAQIIATWFFTIVI